MGSAQSPPGGGVIRRGTPRIVIYVPLPTGKTCGAHRLLGDRPTQVPRETIALHSSSPRQTEAAASPRLNHKGKSPACARKAKTRTSKTNSRRIGVRKSSEKNGLMCANPQKNAD